MDAIDRSLNLYRNHRSQWNRLAAQDMELEVSWNGPAKKYMELFQTMTAS